ncbi:MAG: hypothetical protein GY940_38035, partial [bacterium]|nr:hypothetical protein [bacterium]
GSVKTNIGHPVLAAGVAGVIKVLLLLKHKKLVKSLHYDQINPYINLEESPFYIVQENKEWTALRDPGGKTLPRRAGVSSFGIGGVNAHVVLEEYVTGDTGESKSSIVATPSNPVIIPLSARNRDRLKEYAKRLLEFIQRGGETGPPRASLGSPKALEEKIRLMLSKLLQVKEEEIEPGQPFQDYGADVFLQTRLLEQLQEEYKVEIQTKKFLEQDRLALTTFYLWNTYAEIRDQAARNVVPSTSTGTAHKTIRPEI